MCTCTGKSRINSKYEYLQLLAEFDRLSIANYYDTTELTVNYQVSSIKNMINLLNFVLPDITISKDEDWLDAVAFTSISVSQRIFLARNCKDWHTN